MENSEKAVPNNIYSVMLRLGILCEHCNSAIPINGFMEEVKCGKCQEVTPLKAKRDWNVTLGYGNPSFDVFTGTRKQKIGESETGAYGSIKLKTWRKWPECGRCKHIYTEDEIKKGIDNNGVLTCPECASTNRMKTAPSYIKKIFPEVLYSLDMLPYDTGNNGEKANSFKPIVMACMSCGGSLHVDGTARLVECKFCGSSNYLPDDLWLSIHPQAKMEEWFILFGPGK
jgi:NAD-dependent SIR2 family protein deacetylase